MEDEMPCSIVVSLCFAGYDGDPSEISSALELTPTSVHKIGQFHEGRGIPVSRAFWSTKLIEGKGDDVGRLVDDAVSSISDRVSKVASISDRTKEESYIGVTIGLSGQTPSINISFETIRLMSEMKVGLDVDLFE